MQGTLRPFATAGVAIVGAGAIVIMPIAPPLHDIRVAPPVQLSAGSDVFAPDLSTLDGAHLNFYNLLPTLKTLNVVTITPTGRQLVNFSATSLSGLLLGLVGPLVAPVVVAGSDINAIGGQDPATALATLLNIPADMVNAFLFGGAHLDITALIQALGPTIGLEFPEGISIGIAFGGLLSPAGSAFNSLDFNLQNAGIVGVPGFPLAAQLATGNPAGPIASLGAVIQVIENGVNAQVSQFDIPAFGTLIGNVLNGALTSALNGLGLGGLLGLSSSTAAANVVPTSVQKSLTASSTPVTKDSKQETAVSTDAVTATAPDDAQALPDKATRGSFKAAPVVKLDTSAKGSVNPVESFGNQVSAAAVNFGASATKGPLKAAKHAKPAAPSSKASSAAAK
jgi:hypothetical protein